MILQQSSIQSRSSDPIERYWENVECKVKLAFGHESRFWLKVFVNRRRPIM